MVLLPMLTACPPVGAALTRVTVAVDDAPPATLVGFSVRLDTATLTCGFTVSVADLDEVEYVAVMVAVLVVDTVPL